MMNFFEWYKPSTWLSSAAEGIMGAIEHSVRTLSFSLCSWIYKIIIDLYEWFEILCTGRLLNSSLIEEIADRVGLILGLVMFFIVIFSLVKMLIEPDTITDKEAGAGALVKKLLIVIVMFGVSNYCFNALYQIQRTVIQDRIISKILLPYELSAEDSEQFGSRLSANLLFCFYNFDFRKFVDVPRENNLEEKLDELDAKLNSAGFSDKDRATIEDCTNLTRTFKEQIIVDKRFELGYNCLNEHVKVNFKGNNGASHKQEVYVVEYNWVLSIVVGIFTAYLLLVYCIKVGLRMVILMFLEMISSLAFVSYLAPKKDTIFSKWLKLYIATYIDVFIRVVIINFVFFLIATIFDSAEEGFMFWDSIGGIPNDSTTENFLMVVIIVALLMFAKQAPELLKELLPASVSKLGFGLDSPKKMWDSMVGGKFISGALGKAAKIGTGIVGGAIGGGAVGLLGGGLGGFAGGVLKGGLSGLGGQGFAKTASSAWKNQVNANRAGRIWRSNGGTNIFGRGWTSLQQSIGAPTRAEMQDADITAIKQRIQDEKDRTSDARRESKIYSSARDAKKRMEDRAESKLLNGTFQPGDVRYSLQESILLAKAKMEKLQQSGTASEQDISSAIMDYNAALDSAKKQYITEAYAGNLSDGTMSGLITDLADIIANHTDVLNDTRINGLDTDISDYDSLDAFDTLVTGQSNAVNRTISNSDVVIQSYEDEILELESTDEYRRAHANKDYKGGK